MKFGSVLRACGLSAALLVHAVAQSGSPEDLYLQAYESIRTADELSRNGQGGRARDRYLEAATTLKKLQSTYPNYNTKAVEFRLDYVKTRAGEIPGQKTTPVAEKKPNVATLPGVASSEETGRLLDQVRALQAENANLSAKLQEALAPKPASVDPTEFAKLQERIQQLEKEKELLRVRADQAQAKQPQAADNAMLEQVRSELAATKQQLLDSVAAVAALTQERNQLQKDKAALEAKPAAVPVATKAPSENARVKEIEKERDALLKRLADAK